MEGQSIKRALLRWFASFLVSSCWFASFWLLILMFYFTHLKIFLQFYFLQIIEIQVFVSLSKISSPLIPLQRGRRHDLISPFGANLVGGLYK